MGADSRPDQGVRAGDVSIQAFQPQPLDLHCSCGWTGDSWTNAQAHIVAAMRGNETLPDPHVHEVIEWPRPTSPPRRTTMPADRTITFPADAAQRLADRLQDENWQMDGDEAMEIARDIVIDVTEAVDKLRGIEAREAVVMDTPHQIIESERGPWQIAVARHSEAETFTFDITATPSHVTEMESYDSGDIVISCHNMTRAQLEEHVARCQRALKVAPDA